MLHLFLTTASFTNLLLPNYSSLEHNAITVTFIGTAIMWGPCFAHLICPSQNFLKNSNPLWFFSILKVITSSSLVILTGMLTKLLIQRLNNILSMLNFKQHVSFSTHSSGHTLEFLITPDDCSYVTSISPSDFISDHCALIATLIFEKEQHRTHQHIKYRLYKKKTSPDLIKHPHKKASLLYNQYHTVLMDLVNRHAPIKTKSVPTPPPDPWISEDILKTKQTGDALNVHGAIQDMSQTDVGYLLVFISITASSLNLKMIGTLN